MRLILPSLAALGLLISAPHAHADIVYAQDQDVSSFVELKVGTYTPDIDAEFDVEEPYEDIFQRTPIHFELEYDRQFWREFGSLGAYAALGWNRTRGNALDEDGTSTNDQTRLSMIPIRAGLVYRFDVLAERWGVPLVVSLKGGLDYTLWFVRSEAGIADFTSDAGVDSVGRGGTAGYHVALGGHLLLDFLAPRMAANFDTNAGVENTYLFAELMMAQISDFGSSKSWDLSDTTALFGLGFEF